MNTTRPHDEVPATLDTNDLARLLHLTPRRVGALVRAGRIPAQRIPGTRKYTYRTNEILTLLATEGPQPSSEPTPRASRTAAPGPTDPIDITVVVATIPDGPAERQHCLDQWIAMAEHAGLHGEHLVQIDTGAELATVVIDAIAYTILATDHRRIATINNDSDPCWQLAPTVWAKPGPLPEQMQ